MKLEGPILLGTDFSAASDEALRQANDLATDRGTALIVCHIVPALDATNILFPEFAARDEERRDALMAHATLALERQLGAILGDAAKTVTAVVDSGSPHAGLLAQAEATNARVIVLGPGRTAERVARHAAVRTLIARDSPRGPVIAATDFSDPSFPALEAAATEARRRGSRLKLLHVVDVGTFALAGATGGGLPFLPGTRGASLPVLDDLRLGAEDRLRETLSGLAIEGEALVQSGPAAQTIVDVAGSARAALIVVATHGRSGLARLTLGSTAEAVIRSAPCSVLVVRLAA